MSNRIYVAIAATLLSLSGCTPENSETSRSSSLQASAPAATYDETVQAPVAGPKDQPASPPGTSASKTGAKMAPPAKVDTLTQDKAMVLAKQGNCLSCHRIEAKLVGPAWKDVAAKYNGDNKAQESIAANIKKGGSFGWKSGFMPPRGAGKLSDNEIETLAGYIATLN